jgi:hypothetical protein
MLKSVSWDCRDWVPWLYQLLSPLNVFLIFFTEDTRIGSVFDDLVTKGLLVGRSLRLKGLNATEGQLFVERRFGDFRVISVNPETFPFNPAALPRIFHGVPEERVGVKFLIQILRNSLNAKIAELDKTYVEPPPPPANIQIEWLDIFNTYQAVVNKR